MVLRLFGLLLLSLAPVLVGCGRADTEPPVPPPPAKRESPEFALTSSAFKHNEAIPIKYTADGQGISPPLAWIGAPAAKRAFALIMDDPDAPRETFTHWVIYGIPAQMSTVPENVLTGEVLPDVGGARQGKNSARTLGYFPPSPPPGKVHHYTLHLYALEAPVTLPAGATADELRKAMEGHVLATAELTGTYQRTR